MAANAPSSIEGRDYLDATIEASKRTRSVTLTMVVASILILVALINSLDRYQWMLERMHALGDPQSEYVKLKIGAPPNQKDFPNLALFNEATRNYHHKYEVLYEAVVESYVDSLSTGVPLFGFSVDACGGIALVVILLMYRYCLMREVENMRLVRKNAERFGQAREFYEILAMRQVFKTPPSDTLKRRRLAVGTPKMICALPLLVHSAVTAHDFVTIDIGAEISPTHNIFLVIFELLVVVCLIALTKKAIRSLRSIDEVWKEWWEEFKGLETKTSEAV
jgi:hypothetical protein